VLADGSVNTRELHGMVKRYAEENPECRQLQQEWLNDQQEIGKAVTRLQEIVGNPQTGAAGKIQLLETFIDSARVKDLGVSVELDEMQRAEAERNLNRLVQEEYRLRMKLNGLMGTNKARSDRYDQIQEQFRDYVVSRIEERQERTATEQAVETEAQKFEREAYRLIDAAIGMDAGLAPSKAQIRSAVVTALKLEDAYNQGQALDEDLWGFIYAAVQQEKSKLDEYHRAQSAAYAGRKLGDAGLPAAGAPPQLAPVSGLPPAPASGRDPFWDQRLKGGIRALRQNVAAARRG
jgi:hypothetical protein